MAEDSAAPPVLIELPTPAARLTIVVEPASGITGPWYVTTEEIIPLGMVHHLRLASGDEYRGHSPEYQLNDGSVAELEGGPQGDDWR